MRDWLRWLFGGRDAGETGRIEAEIDEEISFHLEMRRRDNLDAGMSREEAEREAVRRFGSAERIRAVGARIRRHEQRRSRVLEGLRADLRFALRDLRLRPGFTLAAVLTLALGIGANTAVFSVLHAVVLRPLPYEDPASIAYLWGWGLEVTGERPWERMESVERGALMTIDAADVTGIGEPERLRTMPVSEGFFEILGVEAASGRVLVRDDHRPDAPPAVVLADSARQRLLGGRAEAIGATILLDGTGFTVVGVMPAGFHFLKYPDQEAWLPIEQVDATPGMALARLAPGATVATLAAEARGWSEAVDPPREGPRYDYAALRVESLREMVIREADELLLALAGVVGLVLLIACANVAHLLLSRLSERRREMAVRAALGAGRGRLARQLLTESGVLALLGGASGLALAYWTLPAILALRPAYGLPRLDEVRLDATVLAVTAAVTMITGLLFGAAPVLALGRGRLATAMSGGGRGASPGVGGRRLRRGLVVVEVALALVVVIGAGLFVRSFLAYRPADPGFVYDDRLTFEIDLGRRFDSDEGRRRFVARARRELGSLPGVESVAATTLLPMGPVSAMMELFLDPAAEERAGRALYSAVSDGYFDVFGIPVLEGRRFAPEDRGGEPVAIVNRALARHLWPDGEPLGQRFTAGFLGLEGRTEYTVVGVAADARLATWDAGVRPSLWVPLEHSPSRRVSLVLASRVPAEQLIGTVREAMAKLDPTLPLTRLQTMAEWFGDMVSFERFTMVLMLTFGGVALALAAIGFYGVVSFSVARRAREFGVRVALGAWPRAIVGLVLREGAASIGLGVVVGLAGALATIRFVEAFLFGIEPYDPWMLAALTGVLAAGGLAACWIPAARASRADPVETLRAE